MFQKILILILFALPTFAQSPFSKMEGFFDGTATTPSTPRNIAAVGDTNKVTLTWTDPSQSDFDSVRVYAGTTANPTTWIASVAKGVQSYVDTNYSYNTIRHYRLKALTTSGDTSNYTSSVNDTVMIWLGSELVTNGGFANATGWTVGGAWTVSGGVVTHTAGSGTIVLQNITLANNVKHRVSWDIANYVAGSMGVSLGEVLGTLTSGNGSFYQDRTSDAADYIYITCS